MGTVFSFKGNPNNVWLNSIRSVNLLVEESSAVKLRGILVLSNNQRKKSIPYRHGKNTAEKK